MMKQNIDSFIHIGNDVSSKRQKLGLHSVTLTNRPILLYLSAPSPHKGINKIWTKGVSPLTTTLQHDSTT